MARLTNARSNHMTQWVIPAAKRLLIENACKSVPSRMLSEVAQIEMGQSPLGESCNDNQEGLPLLGGPADLGLVFPQVTRWTSAPTKLCQAGDIIVCVRATIGEPRWADGVYCLGRGVAGVRPIDSSLGSKFLFYIIEGSEESLQAQGTGTTFKTISKHHLTSIKVPILPKEEQDEIVDFLSWLEQNSETRPDFSYAPHLPSLLSKQLKIVVRIEELAAKIEEARGLRREVVEETEEVWLSSLGTVFEELTNVDQKKTFREICEVVRGGSPRPAGDPIFYDGPIPFLKVADLTNDTNKFVTRFSATIKEVGLSHSRYVEPNTLMLTNSGATLGVPKICTFGTCFNDGIQAFLNIPKDISKEYLYYFLTSKTRWFREYIARGQGQPNLNTEMVKMMTVPLPPFLEQQRIVSYLDSLQAKVDILKREQTELSAELDALLPSILDKAFKGEL